MYSFDGRVRYSEVDDQGKLTFTSVLDYFQDCSSFQSEDLKIGVEFLKEKRVAWVLISWQIEVKRYPEYGERIQVSTWPYDFKGFYGFRNFLMMDAAGNRIAWANSLWVLLDTESGRPARVLPEMVEAYQLEPPLSMAKPPRKMVRPGEMEAREPFAVHKFHLDTNRHVNNGKYILMAQEYLPPEFVIGTMRAEYKKSAVYGDIIYPSVTIEDNRMAVALCQEDGSPYVMIELEKKYD